MNSQFGQKKAMLDSSERLSAYVCQLMSGGYVAKTNQSFHKLLPDKMAIKLNVFCTLMEDRIFSNINGS